MKILALDVATVMGVAFGRPQTAPVTWTVGFGEVRDHDARFAKAIRFIRQMHHDLAPDLVVIEAAIGGKDANAFLIGLVACIRGAAKDLGIKTAVYANASIRKHFIGKHLTKRDFPHLSETAATKAIKAQVFNRCRALGWAVSDYDQSDAAALWDYACAHESMAHHLTSLPGMFQGKAK